jgi:hypothetical protein
MKLDYVILGSNNDPMYIDFWHIISKIWKTVFNITPILGLISEEDSEFYESEFGLIKKFKAVDGVNIAMQSQIVRLYLTKLLKGNVIISDIDMSPLSKSYFIEQVKEFSPNKIYVMSSDNIECKNDNQIPMCYIIADSNILSKSLKIDTSWSEFVKKLNDMNFGWYTDQKYLWLNIQNTINKNKEAVVLLNRGWKDGIADKRIDRAMWNYDSNLVKNDKYIDAHLLRPYSENKEEIDKLIGLICETIIK